jgi:hypothetical protein
MLLLLALATAGSTADPSVAEWVGGPGDWSDPLMWRGERPGSASVREVHLCAWQSSQIVIGLDGGSSQPTVVLCDGLLLDIAGRVSVAPAAAAPSSPAPTPVPPSSPPQDDLSGGPNGMEFWTTLPLGVWIAIAGGGLAGCVLIIVLLVWAACVSCKCRSRKQKPPRRGARDQVQPEPQPSPEPAEEEEWPSNSPSFTTSQRWSGHV